jgi:dTDP-4-amino-4,6-dideoxygalactose transaminase
MSKETGLQSVIPIDLGASYRAHKAEIDRAIQGVLDKGWYILGQEVTAFEEEFAKYIGVRHGIGVANGTDALHVALRAGGIRPGDSVITVSHTAVATVAAVELAGAIPILVDIDPQSYTMDPTRLKDTLRDIDTAPRSRKNSRPKAVVVVHLYGQPADMPAIIELARQYDLLVVEDCAQAHGSTLAAKKAGTWGSIAAFSFYPTKNLGAFGDGGAVVTNDPKLAERVRLLREYGWKERYISQVAGFNTRLDELQAAILRVKLKSLDAENIQRRKIGDIYDTALAKCQHVAAPWRNPDAKHIFHQYVVRTKRRDSLREFLKKQAIGALIHYPRPVHLQPAYMGRIGQGSGGLSKTELACREVLSMPIYGQISESQAEYVAEQIVRWDSQ